MKDLNLGSSDYNQLLEQYRDKINASKLIFIGGMPGAGKSFIAQRIVEIFGGTCLEIDEARDDLFPDPQYTLEESIKTYEEIYRRAKEVIKKGKRVLVVGSFIGTNERERAFEFAQRTVKDSFLLIWIEAPRSVNILRLEERLKSSLQKAGIKVYKKFQRRVKTQENCSLPDPSEGNVICLKNT